MKLLTIDLLDDQIFTKSYQYLSQQFELVSFKVQKSSIILICGIFKSYTSDINYVELKDAISSHVHTVFKDILDVLPISGYDLSVYFRNIRVIEDLLSVNQTYYKIYSLSNLSLVDTNAKIFKILLETSNISLLLSTLNKPEPNHYFSILLKEKEQVQLSESESQVVSNLKKSPYITGQLQSVSSRYIKTNPGRSILGITSNTISYQNLIKLIELISTTFPHEICSPEIKVMPTVNFSKNISGELNTEINSSLGEDKVLSKKISMKNHHKLSPTNTSPNNSRHHSDPNPILVELSHGIPDLFETFADYGWKILDQYIHLDLDVPVLRIGNENLEIEVIIPETNGDNIPEDFPNEIIMSENNSGHY